MLMAYQAQFNIYILEIAQLIPHCDVYDAELHHTHIPNFLFTLRMPLHSY